MSPRPPPKTSYKDNWMCDLDSEVAVSSKDNQRIQAKPNTQLSSTGRLVTKWSEETLERTKFDHDALSQEEHDNVTDSTSTGRSVYGSESTKRWVLLLPTHVEEDQTRTVRPVLVKEHEINWFQNARTVTCSCERSRTSVKKIEHHPHREALHADLQQNNVYNPFSFLGIKELCIALADNAWLTANPEDFFSKLRLDTLSVPN